MKRNALLLHYTKKGVAMKRLCPVIVLLIAAVPLSFGQVGQTTGGPLTVAGVPIYGVADSGDLLWYFHRGAHDGSANWANQGQGGKIGNGWNEGLHVFKGSPSGNDGVIYRVDSRGDLYWYKHDGSQTGAANWSNAGNGKKVGNGWQGLRLVFAAGNGVIYAINRDGDLLWYRHLGYANGSGTWANQGTGAKVGTGWGGARMAFAGGNGIIYLADRSGNLFWFRHTGAADGTLSWANNATALKVGNGWNDVASAFAGGDGLIYALKRDGNLYWYRHAGFL